MKILNGSAFVILSEIIRRRLILGVVWQIIKIQLMSKISFKNVPNLAYLLESGEDKAVLAKLSGESILLRWVNFHLKRTQLRVSNFSSDLSVRLFKVMIVILPSRHVGLRRLQRITQTSGSLISAAAS